jgi:hypothetical protein
MDRTAAQTPPHVPSGKPPSLEELEADLQIVLRAGLPLAPTTAGRALLSLRGVWARAVDPRDPLARVDAADRLIRQQLRKLRTLGYRDLKDAAQILFGLGDGKGRNLTNRRAKAAQASGYDYHHFRKHIEPKILEQLAWQLHRDSLQYVPRARKTPPPAASGDTPTIADEDVSDPDRAEHEIALSRIWSGVYALRAELIARELYRGDEKNSVRFDEAEGASRRVLGGLLLDLDDYLERWGDRILHGDAEYNAEALIRLAGWTGELTAEQARELRWEAARARAAPQGVDGS